MDRIKLPESQYDVASVRALFKHSSAELQPYLRNLLHYLDDINWPVFELVSQLIGEKFSNELLVPFREILIENDHLWKECYFIALLNFPRSTLDVLFPLIEHFAIYPKRIEMDEGIQQRAANIIFKRFSEKVIFLKNKNLKTYLKIYLFFRVK